MKNWTIFANVFLLLIIGCSKNESIPGDHGAISAQQNKSFFEDVGHVTPYNNSSPYITKMQNCIYADSADKSCAVADLPLIGLSASTITIQNILDRTLVSHEFLGETFKQVLLKMNPEMLQMFGSVSAIVISDKINPSFYFATSGAIYLSGRYFWRNSEEKKILTQVKDPRIGAALPLQFLFDFDYIKDGKSITNRARKDAQTYDEMAINVAHLLFHELTHSNDYFPRSLYLSQNMNLNNSYHKISYDRHANGELISDRQSTKLASVELKHIGQILYQGLMATTSDSAILAEEIIHQLKNDLANDPYAYSSRREDLAMQAEEALMLYYYNFPRYVGVIKLPSANFNPPLNYIYQLAWGEKSRVLEPRILSRALFAVTNDLGAEIGKKIEDKLSQSQPIEIPANTSWNDIEKASVNASTTCLGPEDATHALIYLHGIDSKNPSAQELHNREILSHVAEKLKIKIALPRATMECPNQPNSICWGWKFNSEEMANVLPKMLESRTSCFLGNQKFGILGFSNGGYFVNRWYTKGLTPKQNSEPAYLIASGSDQGTLGQSNIDLSNNPPLALLIGNKDFANHNPTNDFFIQLKAHNANVENIEFDGGHELNEAVLISTLSKLLN